ncbi:MAG: 1-(5-phosphoribosyl)-5-((5-phosphoribosylamino)methylideneamino)imidazole-4-carboxamide isomerase [Gammaproteobacteria bacterium]|nr:1-(5-phosphoribosyl)-5-((5-phosphoribosylamino)methylideneamino)imidazole-4-carboxamide isomerase [Gammaproteobacteria bacterium]
MILIPAIDIRDGACVRLLRGDFDTTTVYDEDPVAPARRYARLGAPLLHLVDLDGAEHGQRRNSLIIAAIAQICPVQAGGGIRSADDVAAMLDLGVARVVIGSLAVTDPRQTQALLERFGPGRIVLAIDVRSLDGQWHAHTHGWTVAQADTIDDVLACYIDAGLRHVLVTDIDRDGAMTGPSVALYRDLTSRYPGLQLQASGGVRDLGDLNELRSSGCAAAISGKALLENTINEQEAGSFLQSA